MNALIRKELREQSILGVPLALAWISWWGIAPPISFALGPSWDGIAWVAMASILMGLALGFAPFEVERTRKMRPFLAHRGVSLRAVAVARIAVACAWASAIVVAGHLILLLVHLQPALAVRGFVPRTVAALAAAGAILWPALALGSLAGCIDRGSRTRWALLIAFGLGMVWWGAQGTRQGLLESPAGLLPYLGSCLVVFVLGSSLAVGRFVSATQEDRPLPIGLLVGTGWIAVSCIAPVLLLVARSMQHWARSVAWHSNVYWLRTADGTDVERAQSSLPQARAHISLALHPVGNVDLSKGEQVLFHPITGTTRYWDAMLGSRPHWEDHTPWAISRHEVEASSRRDGHGWAVWIDQAHPALVTVLRNRWRRASVHVTELPRMEAQSLKEPWLVSIDQSAGGEECLLWIDSFRRVQGIVLVDEAGGRFRVMSLPENDKIVETIPAADVILEDGAEFRRSGGTRVLIGRQGNYVFDGDTFRPVASYTQVVRWEEDARPRIEAVVRAYEGLSYSVELTDLESGEVVASARVAPRSLSERVGALVALGLTLVRLPISTMAVHALHAPDEDGSRTPSQSIWIDPLVLGGRRPWLVALHIGVAGALAWVTRRRLGGRAWGWPLAVLALGVPAWLVCLLLEPRRAARAAAVQPRARAAWAPIVDRASV